MCQKRQASANEPKDSARSNRHERTDAVSSVCLGSAYVLTGEASSFAQFLVSIYGIIGFPRERNSSQHERVATLSLRPQCGVTMASKLEGGNTIFYMLHSPARYIKARRA
ncbi:hypothetical protein H0G86_006950 [Trichoderma simmonsii]|uniref:Uncharacterized protein n=1 Tax=Trichoderma simmonsii TaxID=1491479 RepID=A0A8G0LFF3_9HYPO|nr:hypothetical protein H0G86_006950 [Trichoderma simmonsii]